MKKYSFIPIAFITLVFGIIFIPKIIKRITDSSVIENTRLSAPLALSFLEIEGQLRKVPDFVFTNQDNRVITNEDYIGKVYVVEFFFSTCPTICPIMNKNLSEGSKIFMDIGKILVLHLLQSIAKMIIQSNWKLMLKI